MRIIWVIVAIMVGILVGAVLDFMATVFNGIWSPLHNYVGVDKPPGMPDYNSKIYLPVMAGIGAGIFVYALSILIESLRREESGGLVG